MDQYEVSRSNLESLVTDYEQTHDNRNEATTRLHFIDRLLFDCLGWSTSDCIAEKAYDGEYADYTCLAPRPILIVEAKKEGNYFQVPAGSQRIEYQLQSLLRDNPDLDKAVRQVAGYCQSRGVLFAAVANGHQLVIFVAVRQDSPPLEGRAIVFPSLRFMLERFQELWNALSKPAIQEKRLESRLVGRSPIVLPAKLSARIHGYPGTKARNVFQTDLKTVSEIVLEDVANAKELETRFLGECYCESGALSDYSLISKNILQARYEVLFDEEQPGPNVVPAVNRKGVDPDLLAKSISRRPILILGDVGVGKTTFLRHMMTVNAVEQFKNAIALHLNLGIQATLTMDLRVFVIDEIARRLREEYDIDIEERGLVRGIYYGELQRFNKGIYGSLKKTNPGLYQEKELFFLEEKLNNKAEHLKSALEHLEKARHKQIIILIDNCDQRDYNTQQQAFLIAQEIAANWPATAFITLRPETFHLSMRSGGTLSGYHPKAFTIAPPRIDRVLDKRLKFGLRITRGEIPIKALSSVSLKLHSLDAILDALLHTLSDRRDIGELIDNIADGNVRLALDLVQRFLGSGHVDTQKIIDIYTESHSYNIPIHEFLRAVIYGDEAHYDPSRSYIANIFDISTLDHKEHFLLSIILNHLDNWNMAGTHSGFMETSILYDQVQGMGFTPEQIDSALVRAYTHNLIEPAARRPLEQGKDLPPSLRITSVGAYHLHRLLQMFAYLDAVIVDTPILDDNIREKITNVFSIEERLNRAVLFCDYLDLQWKYVPKHSDGYSWPVNSATIRKEIQSIKNRL